MCILYSSELGPDDPSAIRLSNAGAAKLLEALGFPFEALHLRGFLSSREVFLRCQMALLPAPYPIPYSLELSQLQTPLPIEQLLALKSLAQLSEKIVFF